MDLKARIRKRLSQLQGSGCEVAAELVRLTGDTELFGIVDFGEAVEEERRQIKIIPIIRGLEEHRMGDAKRGMPLGNNPEGRFEFIHIRELKNEVVIEPGDRLELGGEVFVIEQCMPVLLGMETILEQVAARRVK